MMKKINVINIVHINVKEKFFNLSVYDFLYNTNFKGTLLKDVVLKQICSRLWTKNGEKKLLNV